ncbi:sulfotransferase family protein [Martelella sp. FOR1707]
MMTNKYLCNLLIPGAAKSGTSSLHQLLGRHPRICPSSPKEPQFFSFSDRYDLGPDEHNKIFTDEANYKYWMEGSQCYFTHQHAIERIKESLHNPRIILVLRDPIERLLSQYAWNYRRGTEVDSLEKAIRSRGDDTSYVFDPRINTYRELGGYVAFSRYTRWVPQWQEKFGKENVLILKFEDMRANQQATLKACYDFLELEPIASTIQPPSNSTAKTTTKILPKYIISASSLIPSGIKNNDLYKYVKASIRTTFTKKPNLVISDNLNNYLHSELSHDIVMHSELNL